MTLEVFKKSGKNTDLQHLIYNYNERFQNDIFYIFYLFIRYTVYTRACFRFQAIDYSTNIIDHEPVPRVSQ